MFSLLALPRYHWTVLSIYLALCVFAALAMPEVFVYSLHTMHLVGATSITIVCVVIFFLFRRFVQKRTLDIRPRTFLAGVIHGGLFAFPEEVLFRGILQTWLATLIASPVLVVLTSSFIFGIAHLPNGALRRHPGGWNWEFGLVAFLGGIPLGALFLLTESLLFPTLLHMLFLVVGRVTPREKLRL